MTRTALSHRIAVFTLACLAPAASADVTLPSILSQGMVLQQQADVTLWGWADPGEHVTIRASWNEGAAISARTGEDGRWTAQIRTPAAGAGPQTILVSGGHNDIRLDDVLLGEVWLCSGQSNMEWPLAACRRWYSEEDFSSLLSELGRLPIRQFDVVNSTAPSPNERCDGRWLASTPQNAPGMSAVAVFFARHLHERLGVPIGLVNATWGGTICEAWTSAEGLRDFPEFTPAVERNRLESRDPASAIRAYDEARAAWWNHLREVDPGSRDQAWAQANFDDSDWQTMDLPGFWESKIGAFDGVVWFRRTYPTNAFLEGGTLELGAIDDMDTVWLDGTRVGGLEVMGRWQETRAYDLPRSEVRLHDPSIAIRVVDTGGDGGIRCAPDLFRVVSASNSNRVTFSQPLAGPWKYKLGASMADLGPFPQAPRANPNVPTVLYNAMIAPIDRFKIRGAIWYQGEANRGRAEQYQRLLPAMIQDWRRTFHDPELPFYLVQIAPFAYGGDQGQAAEIREAQLLTMLNVPHTGMAAIMDLGETGDIHPVNKDPVGERLARWALSQTYGLDVACRFPLATGIEQRGRELVVHFDHAAGLHTLDGAPPAHFEIAEARGEYQPASARIEADTVVLSNPTVTAPVRVRYCWGAADEGTLANEHGLTASSFRLEK
ncbi:MAG: 9-O-acetylesterase [Phycisphaeraceae bacterium]|nr:9-O-acetylesterase [Phycisphaeraceae bacterium]